MYVNPNFRIERMNKKTGGFNSMKKNWHYGFLCLVSCLVYCAALIGCSSDKGQQHGREIIVFDSEWKFFKEDVGNAQDPAYDDTKWRNLKLPHDWSIEGTFSEKNAGGMRGGFVEFGIGWYRKTFNLSPEHHGKKIFIQFDGIYKNSDVWINGKHLGKRWYGYVSFQYDLTAFINWDGNNVIAVRVDNSSQSSRWYSGSGIYRHVWLTIFDKLHIQNWGTAVTTPSISKESAIVRINTVLENEYDMAKTCTLVTEVLDPDGEVIATSRSTSKISARGEHNLTQDLLIERPSLWSAESPTLYQVKTTASADGAVVDDVLSPLGIRKLTWDSQRGFLVNGKSTVLKGVSIHHDLGCLGAAFHERAMERRLEILKEMGCNAIRTSHNPPAPQFLDMCDRMGFYVIDEAFDKWGGKYYETFSKDWKRDLRSMIQRDRNHPCIILWSVGNEVKQQTTSEGTRILKMLTEFAHKEDPSRKITCGMFPQYSPEFAKGMDIVALNYQEQWFDEYRNDIPDVIILSSESYAYYRGKGNTHKAFHPLNPWLDVPKNEFVVGSFVWTGIDYLGEAVAGWPFHGWNCSLIDLCGFRRPVSYLHESFWSDKPMVHIAVLDDSLDVPTAVKDHWGWPKMVSHWTLPQYRDKVIKICTFSNCDSVELLINGNSIDKKALVDFDDRMITWENVPYEPGTIKAIGINGGKRVCSHDLKTAGKAVRINFSPDRRTIKADGYDLCHVRVSVSDADGIPVPSASYDIQFTVSGPGKIIGVDNGDVTSFESYRATHRELFYGKALVILQSTEKAGKIRLTGSATGLTSETLTINSNHQSYEN
jgi:beta-galactosidase